jgi:hypothetical protein
VQNTESLKSISLYTGNSDRYEKAEKRIESLQHKEKCSESDVCGFVLWELLKMKKNKTKEDNDLIWKLGNQLKHW